MFADPVREIVAHSLDEVVPAIAAVHDATAQGLWAAGYVSYEAAPAFEPAMRVRSGHTLPLVRFGVFESADVIARTSRDPVSGPGNVIATSPGQSGVVGQARSPVNWIPSTDRQEYDAAIATIREAIANGDVYQVNHTFRLHAARDDFDYEALRAAQGSSAYTADLDYGDTRILSLSPELFFQRRGDMIVTRPMKGTRRRGRWTEEDRQLARELAESPKDRAENLMIVDLMRNDLGRVARTGTVKVPAMFEIERYRTVWQMTSTITAELRERTTLVDLFASLFPSGSVTGAPKIAATRFIASLESSPREVYCGAIGFVRPGGDCTFNVPIRTLRIDRPSRTAVYGVGAGITWDSAADAEYAESLAKAELLNRSWPRFEILETMRSEDGRVERLERHLGRMREAAEYYGFNGRFDFNFDFDFETEPAESEPEFEIEVEIEIESAVEAVRQALIAAANEHPGPRRLRILISPDGTFTIDSTADEPPPAPVRVAFAKNPVDSGDPFLYHKTTARGVYEERLAERPDAWDVLLVNERGEVTEFTRGNVVVEIGGSLWTPPREAGLLAGTMRAELLEAGRIAERTIRPEDVRRADRLWLINSVRGMLPVELLV